MPDPTERLAALLAEHEYATALKRGSICRCGFVPEVVAESLQTLQDYHRAHVAAALAEAGVGFVAEVERERDAAREKAEGWA